MLVEEKARQIAVLISSLIDKRHLTEGKFGIVNSCGSQLPECTGEDIKVLKQLFLCLLELKRRASPTVQQEPDQFKRHESPRAETKKIYIMEKNNNPKTKQKPVQVDCFLLLAALFLKPF